MARADEHGQRAPVNRVSQDELGLEVEKRLLEADGLGGNVASEKMHKRVPGHLHTGRLLHRSDENLHKPFRQLLGTLKRVSDMQGQH